MAIADHSLRRLVELIRPRRPKLGAPTAAMFEALRREAEAEGLALVGYAHAGSIAHGTGLRRYQDRECSIPGQAVDLVIELAPGAPPSHATFVRLAVLAERCFAEAGAAAPDDFRRDRLRWRLLPIFGQRGPEGFAQHLVVPGGRFLTSVGAHTRAVRDRTRASVEQVPGVAFNDCVRLLKLWRSARPPVPGLELSSLALEGLASAAFDELGVREGFAATLASWAADLARFDPRSLRDIAGDRRELLIGWSEGDHAALQRWFDHGATVLGEVASSTDEAEVVERLALALFGPALRRTLAALGR